MRVRVSIRYPSASRCLRNASSAWERASSTFRCARGTTRLPRGSGRLDRRLACAPRRAGSSRNRSGEAAGPARGRAFAGRCAAASRAWPHSRRARSRPSTLRRAAGSTVRGDGGSHLPVARSSGLDGRHSRLTLVLRQLRGGAALIPVHRDTTLVPVHRDTTLGGQGALCLLRPLALAALLDRQLPRPLCMRLLFLLRGHLPLLPVGRASAAASCDAA